MGNSGEEIVLLWEEIGEIALLWKNILLRGKPVQGFKLATRGTSTSLPGLFVNEGDNGDPGNEVGGT